MSKKTYELWDLASGNRLQEFPTTLLAARHLLDIQEEGLEDLALGAYDPATGRTQRLADGPALIKWAQENLIFPPSVGRV